MAWDSYIWRIPSFFKNLFGFSWQGVLLMVHSLCQVWSKCETQRAFFVEANTAEIFSRNLEEPRHLQISLEHAKHSRLAFKWALHSWLRIFSLGLRLLYYCISILWSVNCLGFKKKDLIYKWPNKYMRFIQFLNIRKHFSWNKSKHIVYMSNIILLFWHNSIIELEL